MRRRIALLLSLAVAAPAASFGQNVSVFGFTLGQPIELQDCPFKTVGGQKYYPPIAAKTCIEEAQPLNGYGQTVRRIAFAPAERPAIVKNFVAFPLELDGVLIGIHFLTPGAASQAEALDQLRQKFGEPTTLTKRMVQNAMGASFEAVSAGWVGPAVKVTFNGITNKLETGEVYIDLPAATALRSSWQRNERKAERPL